ncbi:hypothetical protein CAMGR0001_2257 [Campylobacter gracilis RM3268]|uniref:Uncharacterized protein n=1 Tax=Campylobacter gracilis RM3268 TaxID=553220 RepID=C8PH69_9BACT|nr:hypothetical protein CAMGR0001_2257 [Campylobacter gracilis RM3268]
MAGEYAFCLASKKFNSPQPALSAIVYSCAACRNFNPYFCIS